MIFSLIFYAWGEPVWIVLMLISAVSDFSIGLWIDKHRESPYKRWGLILSLVINLSLLGFFKYGGLFVDTANALLSLDIPFKAFGLPIGISFYTFQTLSYTIDVYKDEAKVQRHFLDFLLFVSLFHQLVAGPIVRYKDIAAEIEGRQETTDDIYLGINRLIRGLFKKVILANIVGQIGTPILETLPSELSVLGAWIGSFCFALQIYFDFSGYSDMAIGLGWMFGFHYKENFNFPYMSNSIKDFWRRWHISLGSFFRDYVYIPLGGNRKRFIVNMIIVWFLTGLWHGASWNFVWWGLFNGALILIESKILGRLFDKLPELIKHLYFLIAVLVGWMIFYFEDGGTGLAYIQVMFGKAVSWADPSTITLLKSNLYFFILAIICVTPLPLKVLRKIERTPFQIVVNVSLFLFSILHLIGQSYNPFLYFRF